MALDEQEQAKRTEAQSCESCQAERDRGANYCQRCGRRVKQEPPVQQPSVPQQASMPPEQDQSIPEDSERATRDPSPPASTDETPAPQQELRRCDCGKTLPADARFCCYCRQQLGNSAAEHVFSCRPRGGAEYQVTMQGDELLIGKADECSLRVLDDEYLSRRHARIHQADGELFVEDLGSANGTFLRVRRPMKLEPGDEILAGTSLIRFGDKSR